MAEKKIEIPIDKDITMPIIGITMTFNDLIDHFKTQAKAAAALGIKQPSIALWKRRGIPPLRQMQIQLLTGGALSMTTPPTTKGSHVSTKRKERI